MSLPVAVIFAATVAVLVWIIRGQVIKNRELEKQIADFSEAWQNLGRYQVQKMISDLENDLNND